MSADTSSISDDAHTCPYCVLWCRFSVLAPARSLACVNTHTRTQQSTMHIDSDEMVINSHADRSARESLQKEHNRLHMWIQRTVKLHLPIRSQLAAPATARARSNAISELNKLASMDSRAHVARQCVHYASKDGRSGNRGHSLHTYAHTLNPYTLVASNSPQRNRTQHPCVDTR